MAGGSDDISEESRVDSGPFPGAGQVDPQVEVVELGLAGLR
jgi:hypothetical protein